MLILLEGNPWQINRFKKNILENEKYFAFM